MSIPTEYQLPGPYLQCLSVEQAVDGLRDVGRVDVVVVGHGAMVVVLERQAEGDQGARVDLELAQQVPFLKHSKRAARPFRPGGALHEMTTEHSCLYWIFTCVRSKRKYSSCRFLFLLSFVGLVICQMLQKLFSQANGASAADQM